MPQPSLLELPREMQDLVERELRPGERVAWARQPAFRFFSAGVIVPMVFAIPFTAFAVFWIGGALFVTRAGDRVVHGGPGGPPAVFDYFPIFGLPFILVGLAMFCTPLWVYRSMARTVYAITNARALVVSRGVLGGITSKSFPPDRVAQMQRVERHDGSGDLVFEVYTERRGTNAHTVRRGFLSVPDVRGVEDVLRRTLLEGRVRDA